MKKETLFLVLTIFFLLNSSFAQPPAGEIQRAEEILEKERILREKLEKREKVFIKEIIVEGASLLSEDQIREIVLPSQRRWLKKEDIQQILEQILQAYEKINISPEISYQIKKHQLKILVKE